MGCFASQLSEETVDTLESSPYLVGIEGEGLQRFAQLGQVVELESDSDIYRRGDFADSFFLVLEGEVAMWAKEQVLCKWASGEGFGEEALATCGEILRPASATTTKKCVLLEIEREVFNAERSKPWLRAFAQRIDQINRLRKAQFLRSVPFLRSAMLNEAQLERIAALFSYHIYDYDEQICEVGSAPEAFYIVCSGRVVSYMTVNDVEVTLQELRSGDYFGEVALVERMPNTSSLRSLNRTTLLVLPASSFDTLLDVSPDVRSLLSLHGRQRTAEALRRYQVPFFKSLSNHSMEQLAALCRLRQYEPDTVICRVGDPGEHFYIVTHGGLRAEVPERGVVRGLVKGSYFGEIALVADLPRSATVTVTEPHTVLLEIEKDDFHAIFATEPSALAEIEIKVLGEHVQLHSILNHEGASAFFEKQLEREFATENIEFWRAADRYLKVHSIMEAHRVNLPVVAEAEADAEQPNPLADSYDDVFPSRRKGHRGAAASARHRDAHGAHSSNNPLIVARERKAQRALERRRKEAIGIYATFIRVGAPKQINVDGAARKRVDRAMERGQFTATLFEQLQTEVYQLMQRDAFSRFQKSELFQDMLQELNAYSGKKVDARKEEPLLGLDRKSRSSIFKWAA